MTTYLPERAEIDLHQHRNDHDPDKKAHRQVNLGHRQSADDLEHAGKKLAKGNADDDAKEYPNGQIAFKDSHGAFSR